MDKEEKLIKEIEKTLELLSKEVREEAKDILKGEKGIMPVNSNQIEIVWVHPCGYGRKSILTVNAEGRKEFEKVEALCKKQYELMKEATP